MESLCEGRIIKMKCDSCNEELESRFIHVQNTNEYLDENDIVKPFYYFHSNCIIKMYLDMSATKRILKLLDAADLHHEGIL
jgi:hypothetical protein